MNRNIRALCLLLSLLVCGEAFAKKPIYASAPPSASGPLALQLAAPVAPDPAQPAMGDYLDEEHLIAYRQEFGGGGVGVGLLLGPLGVAANAAAIHSATKADVAALHDKIPAAPRDLLQQALAARSASAGADVGSAQAQLSPSLYVTRDKDGKLFFWTIVDVTVGEWKGRYSALSIARPALNAVAAGLPEGERKQLESDLVASYAQALDILSADAAGKLPAFAQRKMAIEALSPRIRLKVKYDKVLEQDGNFVVRGLDPKEYVVAGFGFTGVLVMKSSMVQL